MESNFKKVLSDSSYEDQLSFYKNLLSTKHYLRERSQLLEAQLIDVRNDLIEHELTNQIGSSMQLRIESITSELFEISTELFQIELKLTLILNNLNGESQ